jgi:hypothetical protein
MAVCQIGGWPAAIRALMLNEGDQECAPWKIESLRQIGTHIMGRTTYNAMAAHWPYS